jgi:hypothetical protein
MGQSTGGILRRRITISAFLTTTLLTFGGCKADQTEEAAPTPPPESLMVALTPTEYNNTVRDLLGMPTDGDDWPTPASVGSTESTTWPWVFPEEPGIEGFEGQAEGQMPSAYGVEQIQRAASHFGAYTLKSSLFFTCTSWASLSLDEQKACGWDSVERFAQRAWRRSITDEESTRLRDFWEENWLVVVAEDALILTVAGILQSPNFLYRIEHGDTDAQIGDAVPLTDWEMASRLSYFLWDSMPDDALFAAAIEGSLSTQQGVQEQAERMLEDSKAREAVVHFHRQWLGTVDIHKISPTRSAYGPLYGLAADTSLDTSDDLIWPSTLIHVRNSMEIETNLFVEKTLFDGAGTFKALLTDNHGYMSSYTEPLYGDGAKIIAGDTVSWSETDLFDVYGQDFQLTLYPTRFPEDERAGVLTLPSVLALHSYTVHPAPIIRGVFVLEKFACETLGSPPAEAAGTAPPDTLDATATNRERTAEITSPPECAACHDRINPPGFAFENYDAMGGWRDEDNGSPVDATGTLPLQSGVNLTFSNGVELAHQLAETDQVLDCYTLQWLRYALGIHLGADDDGVAEIQESFREKDKVLELLVNIVSSDLFRYLNVGGDE